MVKSDVEGVFVSKPGILIVDKKDDYHAKRAKEVDALRQKDRINNIEHRMDSIESMLQQILQKVT